MVLDLALECIQDIVDISSLEGSLFLEFVNCALHDAGKQRLRCNKIS